MRINSTKKIATPTQNSKKKIEELQKALDYSEAIVTTIPMPLIILYPAFYVRTANKAFYKTFKVTPRETEGKLIYKLGNGQWNIPLLKKLLEEILPKKNVLNDFEVEHSFRDIGHKIMLLNARKVDSHDIDDPLILLAIEDITEERSIESAVEKERKTVLENIPSALMIVNKKWQFTYCNKKSESIIGKKITDIEGKSIWKVLPELVGSPFDKYCRKTIKTGKPCAFELFFPHTDSWFNIQAFSSTDGLSIYFDDITSLVNKRKHIEDLSRQKDDFIGVASHELKTPITSIKGYTQILQMRFAKEGNTNAVELLTRMDAQINKLNNLVSDLLDVTKIEGGKLQYHESNFEFNELVMEVVEEMQQISQRHTLILKLALTTNIYGDRDRIGQVITNFISNAIKYSPDNGEIILTTSQTKNTLSLSIQDFGIGIPKQKQEKLFNRFYRVSGNKEDTFPGMGLGLFISSEIIKRHKGNVTVKSAAGKGSTFSFTIPVKNGLRKDLEQTLRENTI